MMDFSEATRLLGEEMNTYDTGVIFENAIGTLQDEHQRLIVRNRHLQNENERLKSEHYKDDELKNVKEENEKLWTRVHHYGLEDEDYEHCMSWWKKHLEEKHKGSVEHDRIVKTKISMTPHYKFEIEEFAECTCYSIVCERCGEMYHEYY